MNAGSEDPLKRYVVSRPDCVCIFCGCTKETHPQRDFVTNMRLDMCSSCVDAASFLINNKDRLSIPTMVSSMREEWKLIGTR